MTLPSRPAGSLRVAVVRIAHPVPASADLANREFIEQAFRQTGAMADQRGLLYSTEFAGCSAEVISELAVLWTNGT
jgi:hypothetical protein